MFTETEGFVLRQTKTVNGRRILVVFSEDFGKISAGTSISEGNKTKTALSLRPFTYSRFNLSKNRDNYHITSAETLKSFYKIGEDLDKYFNTSYVFELTEKMLSEGEKSPGIFRLFFDFCTEMEKRNKKHDTLVIAYEIKALKILGFMPNLTECIRCGSKENLKAFSVKEGGMVCSECFSGHNELDSLIFQTNFDIVSILLYLSNNPISRLKNLALEDNIVTNLRNILKSYYEQHLGIAGLKSDSVLKKI